MSTEEAAAEAHRRQHARAVELPLHPTIEQVAAEQAKAEKEKDERLEREIQEECVKHYRAFGCGVYDTSQKRKHKMTPGIADLLVFPPGSAGRSFWHEVKTPTGKQSPDEVVFQEKCERAGTTYVLGGVAEALAQIEALRGTR